MVKPRETDRFSSLFLCPLSLSLSFSFLFFTQSCCNYYYSDTISVVLSVLAQRNCHHYSSCHRATLFGSMASAELRHARSQHVSCACCNPLFFCSAAIDERGKDCQLLEHLEDVLTQVFPFSRGVSSLSFNDRTVLDEKLTHTRPRERLVISDRRKINILPGFVSILLFNIL